MPGDGSKSGGGGGGGGADDFRDGVADLEKQSSDAFPGGDEQLNKVKPVMPSPSLTTSLGSTPPQLLAPVMIVVSSGELVVGPEDKGKDSEALSVVVSPKKGVLSRNGSSHDQCRVCQQEKDEVLIDLGCHCRGGLAKSHRSCIDTWFRSRGSNKCEICQQAATNVAPPEPLPTGTAWIWRVDPALRGSIEERRGCVSPLWVAFSILIGGLLLDVLISVTLGVSALPVNIIIGVIVVLGIGTALRLALEFCHEWSLRRLVHRMETNVNPGYHPAL